MTCTYFGATTLKFANDVARLGVIRDEKVPEIFRIPGEEGMMFAASGTDVAICGFGSFALNRNAMGGHPKMLVRELREPVKVNGCDGWFGVTVNLEFLISCKLLDADAYSLALQSNPSPIALSIACKKARTTLKPDFPRSQKGGVNLLDFIEELVYFDLESVKSYSSDLNFTTPRYRFDELRSYGAKELFMEFLHGHGLRFARDAYQGSGSYILDVNYFEKMGLLKVSSFKIYEEFMSGPEAFQRAVRETLDRQPLDATALELPSDLLGDE